MLRKIVAELQSLGLRTEAHFLKRNGGAGPAQGGTLLIEGRPVTLPVGMAFVAQSPYCLQRNGARLFICKDGQAIVPVDLMDAPRFYGQDSREGIPFHQIALRHGKDCLATTILQTCANWRNGHQCRFCGIEVSLQHRKTIVRKSPDQLAEVAKCAQTLDSIQQVLLTTGRNINPAEELSHLCRCASAIKKTCGLPVQAQLLPPQDLEGLERLKDSGVDSVGIHIESFDLPTLSFIAPFKASLGLKRFVSAWKKAVALFGPNQVSSFLIVGIGEPEASVIHGTDFLSDLGVYPFVVPFRPVPGSLMEKVKPPEPEKMIGIYESIAELLKRKGLVMAQQKAGCVRCGACSAMSFFEQEISDYTCHPVWRSSELEQAYAIRQQVFVREQHLFEGTDRDDQDSKSIHLVAEREGQVAGTVRIFPNGGNGHWIGGRLAIQKRHRNSGAGELLVREAVRYVKKQGCGHFTATIQIKNVPFFSRLGWQALGSVFEFQGKLHQLMEADLEMDHG